MKLSYAEIKKKHNLLNKDIAKYFGYQNALSFLNSSAKNRIELGIERFYNQINKSNLDLSDFIVTTDTLFLSSLELLDIIKNSGNKPKKKTIEALMGFKGCIMVGEDNDIYKVIFILDDYRNFQIELKNENFTQNTLSKPNRKWLIELCSGKLSRCGFVGSLHSELSLNLKTNYTKFNHMGYRQMATSLENCNYKNVPPPNEELRRFCIELLCP